MLTGVAARLLALLKALSPTQFENLVFDLLLVSGMRNVAWRTPGADGGRDLEGDYAASDFSGAMTVERWYVECKRYASSIDWPTVYGKIAYAANHRADFLLICTTATLSPQCRSELTRHADQRARPNVRVWDGPSLENRVANEPIILAKYGLRRGGNIADRAIRPLVDAACKSVSAAYGADVAANRQNPALELTAAILEFVGQTISRIESNNRPVAPFITERDLFDWCDGTLPNRLPEYDSSATRVVLAALRIGERRSKVCVGWTGDALTVDKVPSPTVEQLLRHVAALGGLSLTVSADSVTIVARRG